MITDYISKFTYALKSQYIEMSYEDARALSLGGLQDTSIWSSVSGAEQYRIQRIQTLYG
jgi:hypothetical protein